MKSRAAKLAEISVARVIENLESSFQAGDRVIFKTQCKAEIFSMHQTGMRSGLGSIETIRGGTEAEVFVSSDSPLNRGRFVAVRFGDGATARVSTNMVSKVSA